MLSVLAIVISLALLIYLGYKGWSIVLLAPILALLAAILTAIVTGGEFHVLATYTEVFMTNMAGYVKSYFPFFLLGAIFGTVMDQSGSAMAIADFIFDKLGKGKEALAVVLACAVITYGGVSLFVAAFAIYPIGAVLFRKAGIPKRFTSRMYRSWCFYIHNDSYSGYTSDSEYNSYEVFRYRCFRSSCSWYYRSPDHVHWWYDLADNTYQTCIG